MEQAKGVDVLIDELIEREGGYVNHPADRGGPTRFGITEAVARAHGYGGAMAELPRALEALQGERYLRLAEKRPANEAFLYGWLANRIGSSSEL